MESRKFRLPTKRIFLSRPRVNGLLNHGLSSSLVTVTSGPGYEKVVVVANFLRDIEKRVVWMHFSRYDNEPAQFWDKFLTSVGEELPRLAEELGKLDFPNCSSKYDSFMRVFAKEVYDGPQVILVVDDYGDVENGEIQFFFENLAEVGLENFCMILLSARKTSMNLIGMRNAGGVFSITNEDLRFTVTEILDYFRLYGMELSQVQAENVMSITGGWPLALELLAMQQKDGRFSNPSRSMSFPLILELFEKEYFSGFSGDMQVLFIKLALLPVFSMEIVKALAGSDLQVVTDAIASNMFIDFDYSAKTYSFQRLYRDFLSQKRFLLDHEEIIRIYSSAGGWFFKHGHVNEALECFWNGENYDGYLEVLKNLPRNRKSREFSRSVIDCLDRMPKESVSDPYFVNFAKAFFYLDVMEVSKATELFMQLMASLEKKDVSGEGREFLGEIYAALADISLLKNTDEFVEHSKKACKYLSGISALRSKDTMIVGNNEALFLTNNSPGELDRIIGMVFEYAETSDRISNGHGYGFEFLFAAEAALMRCKMDEASEYAFKAIEKSQMEQQHDIICNALFILMRIATFEGDYKKVVKYMEYIVSYINDRNLTRLFDLRDCVQSWFAIEVEDLDRVAPWIASYSDDRYAHLPVEPGRSKMFHSIYLMALRRYEEANYALRQFESIFQQRGLWYVRLVVYTMRSVCYMQCGDINNALAFLWKAYDMSFSNGVILPFVEYGNLIRTLINFARRSEEYKFDKGWMDDIFSRATLLARRHADMISEHRRSQKSDESLQSNLTARELEVLKFLAQGMTREEISNLLQISVNGVKKHITGIYNKLGALNRADAIRIATMRGDI